MDVVVCIKQIVDPGSVEINPLTGKVDDKRLVKIPNPSDLCALEASLQIKEQFGGTVTVISVGPEDTDNFLIQASAMGADRVLRIWEYDWEGVSQPQLIAYALTSFIKRQPVDLIICGDRGDYFHASEVPAWIAEYVGMPLITSIMDFSVQANKKSIRMKRKLEKGRRQLIECQIPAVLAVTKDLNQPREVALSHLLMAMEKGITAADLHFSTVARMIPVNVNRDVCYQVDKLRPWPHLIYTPDSSLSGAERIDGLVTGGMLSKKTEFVKESPEKAAHRMIEFLLEKEVNIGQTGFDEK